MARLTIPQDLLARYHRLYSRERQVRTRREKLRAKLMQLRDTGAQVEPGKFDLRVTTHESVRLSWPRVAKVLDKEMCGWLREHIPPTSTTYVSVVDKSTERSVRPKKKTRFVAEF